MKINDNRKLMDNGNDVIANEWNFFCLRRQTINKQWKRALQSIVRSEKKTRWDFSSLACSNDIFLVFNIHVWCFIAYTNWWGDLGGLVGSSIASLIQYGAFNVTSRRCLLQVRDEVFVSDRKDKTTALMKKEIQESMCGNCAWMNKQLSWS